MAWPILVATGLLGLLYGSLLGAPREPFFPDEFAHFDYVATIASGEGIPDQYTQARSRTADVFACSPLSNVLPLVCGGQGQDPSFLPWQGQNAATVNPPSYYVLTAAGTAIVQETLGADLLTSARISSMMWTLLLCALAAALAVQLGAPAKLAAFLALGLGSSPLVLIQAVVVQTDAAGAALSLLSVIVWMGLRKAPPSVRLSLSLSLAVLASTVRPQSIVAAAAIVVLETRTGSAKGRRRALIGGLSYVVAVGLIGAIDARLRAGPPENGLLEAYVAENWSQRIADTLIQAWLSAPLVLTWPFETNAVRPGGWILTIGGVMLSIIVIVFALRATGRFSRAIGIVGFASLFVLPAILIATVLVRDQALFFQPRYLLTSLAFCACAAVTVRARVIERWLPFLAGGLFLVAATGVALTY